MAIDRAETIARLRRVTWEELEGWAESTIAKRGQGYHRDGRVKELAYTADGALLAWVHGSVRYATLVAFDEGELVAECTCPYGSVCKHAVAVALAHRSAATQGSEPPTVTDDDPRLALLEAAAEGWDEDDEFEDGAPAVPKAQIAAPLHAFLEGMAKEELVGLLEDLARRFPEVHSALETRRVLTTGSSAELVRDTRRLIAAASAEIGWRNDWNDEGSTPDYSEVRDRLELLLQQGYADQVVELGELLLEAGVQQVEQSHDDGETGAEISSCLDIVFQALSQSSFAPAEQMLRAIDMELRDDYGLCDGSTVFWDLPRGAADWSSVADTLLERLRRQPVVNINDFTSTYQRDRLSDWAIRALEGADRHAEIIPLCEREAEQSGSYVRLVRRLVAAERRDEAARWIVKGIAVLDASKPGLSGELRTIQRELWEQAGDWPRVAALHAADFFQRPSMASLLALRAAAERADAWPTVRAAALRYLEAGELPTAVERVVGGQTIPAWPLPDSGLPASTRDRHLRFPLLNILIELAADEQLPDEVLRWYDQRGPGVGGWSPINSDLVADAVAKTHPERTIAIWKQLAEAQIAQTNPRAYEVAAAYLRKLGRLLERQKRADEWRRYVTGLREANKRKRRFVEEIDKLVREGQKIRG